MCTLYLQDINIDATPDLPSLSLSFARGWAKVQAWGCVGGRYFTIPTTNYLVNKWVYAKFYALYTLY